VVQVNAMHLLGIINRRSSKLALNTLVRELFGLCLSHKIVMFAEWDPREINAFADEISKWLSRDDYSMYRPYAIMLDCKRGLHTCDRFSSSENNLCFKFYSINCCRGTYGAYALCYDWSLNNCRIHAPFRLVEKIWRNLRGHRAKATISVPLLTPSTLCHLITPDALHLPKFVGGWVWLPWKDPSLFVSVQIPGGRVISPPDWQIIELRVNFSSNQPSCVLPKRYRSIQEGCHSRAINSWRRNPLFSTHTHKSWLGK
jgi:hypothetical protein